MLAATLTPLVAACGMGAPAPSQPGPPAIIAAPREVGPVATALGPPPRPTAPICDDAVATLARLRLPPITGEVDPGESAELGPLLALLARIDQDLGDDAAAARLASVREASGEEAKIDALGAIDLAISKWLREQLRRAVDPARGAVEIAEAWALAECAWGLLSPPLYAALIGEEGLGARIDGAFAAGRKELGRSTAEQAAELAGALGPSRQRIEKGIFAAAHRRLLVEARQAKGARDRLASRRAAAAFALLRDRLETKNTRGIAAIERQLSGPPAAIDADEIGRQVAIALAKRARKYCSEAVGSGMAGSAAGRTSAEEGASYALLLAPDMQARLGSEGFDRAHYLARWDSFVSAVDDGDDPEELARLSEELVHWNCAYQRALGIRECTSTVDERDAGRRKR